MRKVADDVRRNLQANGFGPDAIASLVLRPIFGENERTDALEQWLDRHNDAVVRGADQPTAVLIAEQKLIFDGLDWRLA